MWYINDAYSSDLLGPFESREEALNRVDELEKSRQSWNHGQGPNCSCHIFEEEE